ncbi:hypothetical protein QUF76_00080 [Desulfobacterales bacterium HSG16]|nr:hypothetical protein [Desulfobacterales bacterium HSG16]
MALAFENADRIILLDDALTRNTAKSASIGFSSFGEAIAVQEIWQVMEATASNITELLKFPIFYS